MVWLKRDLRIDDHAPLLAAQGFDTTVALFVIEPEWLQSPECDASHVETCLTCLAELRVALAQRGVPLLVRTGSILRVFQTLKADYAFTHVLSHEETGPGWTYTRDQQAGQWCMGQGVNWLEFSQTGVVRRLRSRQGWAGSWQARMDTPLRLLQGGFNAGQTQTAQLAVDDIPTLASLGLAPHRKNLQAAGERAACQTLKSFLQSRGRDYCKALSSPLTAESGCSRLSPHLAFGTLSMRVVHQATEASMARTNDPSLAYGLKGFSSRLRWHCHFMQKLESEPAIEFHNFSRACDGLRPGDVQGGAAPFGDADEARFQSWCEGRTGYPMVDACMRSLVATGWLNFRMRAMLVSFASNHLWLHWRTTGIFLARQFLDFEPGIHWSQMQMQSGTTGINTLRMYSPTKQAQDHDPQGLFIRRWVPELARVPLPYLATPWTMDIAVQRTAGCFIGHDYPAPVVDDKTAMKAAKDRLYGLRSSAEAHLQARQVLVRHGSRKSGLPPGANRRTSQNTKKTETARFVQGDLFGQDSE
ncbi:Deoxyribodipyrimidine photolyase [Polaromonas sp. CG9_12]|nr:Deoxyribodipyrimidine photolyase [Polaromonas sp. CG9_12]